MKYSGTIIIALALALVLAACGGAGTNTTAGAGAESGDSGADSGDSSSTTESVDDVVADTTVASIRDRGTVTVGVKFDFSGFGLKNPITGELEGFDVEIAKLVAQEIFGSADVEDRIKFVEAPTAQREALIEQGRVDYIVATYSITDTRKESVAFAGPYFVAHSSIMVESSNQEITELQDLDGKDVCATQGGTSYIRIEDQVPGANLISFDTTTKCFEALGDGRVDAVGTDDSVMVGWLAQNPEADFKILDIQTGEDPYGVGVKRCDDEFRRFINDTLEKLYENGAWAEAWTATIGKIVGQTTAPEPPSLDRYESSGC